MCVCVCVCVCYKNTKAIVRSTGGDTDFLDIVTRVLPSDILVSYLE